MTAPQSYYWGKHRLNDQPRTVAPWQWLARRSSGLTGLLTDRARLGGDRTARHDAGPTCAVCLDTGLVTSRDPYPSSELTVTHGCPFGCHLPDEAAADEASIARATFRSLAAVQETQQ